MTAAMLSLTPEDLETLDCPVTKALANLAAIHRLPRLEHAYLIERTDGRTVVNLALPEIAAEPWRRALAAAPFTPIHRQHYSQHTTEVFWFGATVRLSYTTA